MVQLASYSYVYIDITCLNLQSTFNEQPVKGSMLVKGDECFQFTYQGL